MKILFIACYSPLINNSASIETLQYLNNLAKIDENEVHLLTVNFPKNSIYYDEYILSMLNEKVKMHIISGGKIFEKIMPKKPSNKAAVNSSQNNKSFIKSMLKKGKSIFSFLITFKASINGLTFLSFEKNFSCINKIYFLLFYKLRI
jgi:hypothetical protein